jgi:CHASE2 domain-containing sensor protein
VRALVVVVAVSLLTLVLDHFGWLRSLETAALDRLLILKERVQAHDLVVVEIDDADYEQLFHETSPLDPETLRDVIDAIAKNQPRLIAVDLDTSARVFKGMKLSPDWPLVVWARGARAHGEKDGAAGRPRGGEEVYVLDRIMGSDEAPAGLTSGIALMPEDSDSQIRHFERAFHVVPGNATAAESHAADSFHWAIVKAYCAGQADDRRCERLFPPHAAHAEGEAGHLLLNLSIDPYVFDAPVRASTVLAEANAGEVSDISPTFLALKDKIVLLGGKYESSRDFYETPLGTKYGVDLSAIAVETELSGTGLRHANHYALLALEVAAGLILALLTHLFPHGRKHLLALAAIPVLALFGSLIAFSSFAMWANFVPVLFAAQIHFLYDKLAEARRLESEARELKSGSGLHGSGADAKVEPSAEPAAESPDNAVAGAREQPVVPGADAADVSDVVPTAPPER